MLLLVGLFIALSLVAAAIWMRAPKVPLTPLAVLGLAGLAVCIGIQLVAHTPPPRMPVFQDIQPEAWPRAGLIGDVAYYGFWLSIWFVSVAIGAGLGALSQAGGVRRAAAFTIGLIAVPLLFIAWFFGTWTINCSYAFSQIGHACY
jgi:hypothetical protein